MKLDILVFASHPDDMELTCAGTVASQIAKGKKVGVIDLTAGEMGTRGTPETREQEARDSARILQLTLRENLGLPDAFFKNDRNSQEKIIGAIRKYRPEIVLANAVSDRHPDHGRAAGLVKDAFFMTGLAKFETFDQGTKQLPFRPKALYNYIQSYYLEPDFIMDVSDFWDIKIKAVKAFRSQFYDPKSDEPETYISSPRFMEFVEARGREFGHRIGTNYGEGFTAHRSLGVNDLFSLI